MFKIIIEETKKIVKNRYSNYFKNKSILLIGSSGVVGQYFFSFFINLLNTKNSPKSITAINKSKNSNYFNFFKKSKKVKIIKTDLIKMDFKKLKKYDCIIFSAGYGQPYKFLFNPIETIKLNTDILNQFILKLRKNGKFLFLSSSEVYNGNFRKNLSEEDIGKTNTNDPRASYIEAKRCGECLINIYRKKYGVDAKSVRLCLAYGPGPNKKDNRVLYEFIERSIDKKILEIKDSGLAKRKYIYILDSVHMMLNILVFGRNEIYNVAGKDTISIRTLGKKIANIFKIKFKFKNNKNYLEGSPKNISLSIKRYESEFGRQNFTKFDLGLKSTINWFNLLYKR
jgi:UDP-glucuronate decarboxylase